MSNFYSSYAKGKTMEDILKNYSVQTFQEYQKMAILVRATDDIVLSSTKLASSIDKINHSIESSSNLANKLNSRLLWLNVVLTIITAIGVFFTIANVLDN